MRRYDFSVLAEAMGATEAQAARTLGFSGSTEQKYRREGMSAVVADHAAVRAGLHPFNVWPEMAEHALEATTRACGRCGARFVPVRKAQKWCSKQCRLYEAQAAYQRRRWAADPEWAERQRERKRQYRRETAEYGRSYARRRYAQSKD